MQHLRSSTLHLDNTFSKFTIKPFNLSALKFKALSTNIHPQIHFYLLNNLHISWQKYQKWRGKIIRPNGIRKPRHMAIKLSPHALRTVPSPLICTLYTPACFLFLFFSFFFSFFLFHSLFIFICPHVLILIYVAFLVEVAGRSYLQVSYVGRAEGCCQETHKAITHTDGPLNLSVGWQLSFIYNIIHVGVCQFQADCSKRPGFKNRYYPRS